MSVFVLWEDKAAGSITRFGPHVFLIACVASRLGTPDRYRLVKSIARAVNLIAYTWGSNIFRSSIRHHPKEPTKRMFSMTQRTT